MGNKVILVQSVKGGAGKTSVALTMCINAVLEKKFKEVYYFDFDVDGTGTEYLFSETPNENDKYYNSTNFNIENLCDYIIKQGLPNKDEYYTNAFLLSPQSRHKNHYIYDDGNGRMDMRRLDDFFYENVVHLIDHLCGTVLPSKQTDENLFVIDCSPGALYSIKYFVQGLRKIENLDVIEVFITTFDHSHVEKNNHQIKHVLGNDSVTNIKRYIIFNDIQNVLNKVENEQLYKVDVLERTIKDSHISDNSIFIKTYNEEIIKHSIYTNRAMLNEPTVIECYNKDIFNMLNEKTFFEIALGRK